MTLSEINLNSLRNRYGSGLRLITSPKLMSDAARTREIEAAQLHGPLLTGPGNIHSQLIRYYGILEIGLQTAVLSWPLPPPDRRIIAAALRVDSIRRVLYSDNSLVLAKQLFERFRSDGQYEKPKPQPHIFMGFLSLVDSFDEDVLLQTFITNLRNESLPYALLEDRPRSEFIRLVTQPRVYSHYILPLVNFLRFTEALYFLLVEVSHELAETIWLYHAPLFIKVREEHAHKALRQLLATFYDLQLEEQEPFIDNNRDGLMQQWAILESLIDKKWNAQDLPSFFIKLRNFAESQGRGLSEWQQGRHPFSNLGEDAPI